MPPCLQVTFRNLLPSEPVIDLVRGELVRLSGEHGSLIACHATVVADSDEHYRVALELSLRAGGAVAAARSSGLPTRVALDAAVKQAFSKARSQLKREAAAPPLRSN